MPSRNVSLTDHYDEFIDRSVDDGRYKNASEVIRAGLQLLEQRDAENRLKLDMLRAEARKGMDDYQKGRVTDITNEADRAAFWDEVMGG
jgi:antitoxin ParD1/3/4